MFKVKDTPAPKGGFRDVNAQQDEEEVQETETKPAGKSKGKKADAAANANTPAAGHNSGHIPAVDEVFVRLLTYDAQIKSINAAKKEERNKLKTEYGLLSDTVAIELKLRKKSPEVRGQIEANLHDLDVMLGRKPAQAPEYADPGRKLRPEAISREG